MAAPGVAHLPVPWQPLVEPAATPVPTAAVSSRMAPDELGGAFVRGHHITSALSNFVSTCLVRDTAVEWCTLQVRVGAPIDMFGPGHPIAKKLVSRASDRFVRQIYHHHVEYPAASAS